MGLRLHWPMWNLLGYKSHSGPPTILGDQHATPKPHQQEKMTSRVILRMVGCYERWHADLRRDLSREMGFSVSSLFSSTFGKPSNLKCSMQRSTGTVTQFTTSPPLSLATTSDRRTTWPLLSYPFVVCRC